MAQLVLREEHERAEEDVERRLSLEPLHTASIRAIVRATPARCARLRLLEEDSYGGGTQTFLEVDRLNVEGHSVERPSVTLGLDCRHPLY